MLKGYLLRVYPALNNFSSFENSWHYFLSNIFSHSSIIKTDKYPHVPTFSDVRFPAITQKQYSLLSKAAVY